MAHTPSENPVGPGMIVKYSDTVKQEALELLAEGRMSYREVAKKLGIHSATLYNWKRKDPEFRAKLDAMIEEANELARDRYFASKEKRVEGMNRLLVKIEDALVAQAMLTPGLDEGSKDEEAIRAMLATGLYNKQFKSVGSGPLAMAITEYTFSSATLDMYLKIQKQIAQETGQWTEKSEVEHKGNVPAASITYNLQPSRSVSTERSDSENTE